LLLFLVLTTACAIARQQGKTSSQPGPGDAVQTLPVSSTATDVASQSPTESSERSVLPDAPSQVSRPPSSVESALPSPQFFKFGGSNAPLDSSLVFVGGSSSPRADLRQATGQSTNAPGTTCPRNAAGKPDDAGWFNSLLSVASKGSHYCSLGEGGVWKRGTYAMGRAFAAHNNDGARAFNLSGVNPNGAVVGMPGSFSGYSGFGNSAYAYQYDAGQRMASRYATAIGRDVVKNLLGEFMPDISNYVLHRRP